MLQSRPIIFVLWLLAAIALAYAAYQYQQGLLVAAATLLGVISLQLKNYLQWSALLLFPLAFIASIILHPTQEPAFEYLMAALLTMISLAWLVLRTQGTKVELAWQRNISEALNMGSERLIEARNTDEIMKAGVGILSQLNVAPHIGFVAYRKGTPMILAASGAYESFIEQPIHPSDNDSRSVQADHWVAEEALALLQRDDRQSYLVSPVYGRADSHMGVLILTRPENKEFDEDVKGVIHSFARLLGSQLGQQHAIRELSDSNELTLRCLGNALEYRDDETGGHTQRVVNISMRLAKRLGWSEEQVKALRWGAYLHDLGKLAIPDAILHKPGPLSGEELQIMQQHPYQGYNMLQEVHFLPAETLDLVRYHHERWDGTGYPSGLRGKDIPETARVFAIVDVYDALIHERPYKPAWTPANALKEIRENAGKHFDPHYTEAFLRMMADKDDAKLVK